MTTELVICPYMSSNPYYVGCEKGYLVLLPHKVKCEYRCGAWQNDKCMRLSEGKDTTCNCGGNVNADKSN
jgi:hypothetical protein